MARQTDTRQRVREAAAQLAQEGVSPTFTLVRKILGGGSPNTITDELKRWKEDHKEAHFESKRTQTGIADAMEGLGFGELSALLRSATATISELAEAQVRSNQELHMLASQQSKLEPLVTQLKELAGVYQQEKTWMREEVQKINDRYEGVQRYMLMAIEDARQAASRWKLEAEENKAKEEAWRTSAMAQIYALQEENANLKGKLEERALLPEKASFNVETPPFGQKSDHNAIPSGDYVIKIYEPNIKEELTAPFERYTSQGSALLKKRYEDYVVKS